VLSVTRPPKPLPVERRVVLDSRRRADLGLLAAVLIWGVNVPLLKVALAALHPLVVNVLRFFVSILVLGAAYLVSCRRADTAVLAPLRALGWRIAGLGVLGYFLFSVVFVLGLARTTAGNTALIFASAPLWTALVGRSLGIERLTRRAWGGLALALLGTAVVVAGGSARFGLGQGSLAGNLLVLLAAALWGAYTTLTRPALDRTTPAALAFFGLLVALPLLTVVALPFVDVAAIRAASLQVWVAVGYAGALGTGLAFLWWNIAVRSVGPATAAVYGNGVPIVALAAAAVILDEPVGAVQVVGAVLIVAGVLAVRRERAAIARRAVALQRL
jgi:drug/metabolite transporter (DMT)-like permease